MTTNDFQVPSATDYTDDDFETATDRVRAAREKLLTNPQAAEAHDRLGREIAERLGRKQATLTQVRQALDLTQAQLAQTMHLAQGDISRIEQRTNMQLATLARFIAATGGRLRIVAVYGDTEVGLRIGDIAPEQSEDDTRASTSREGVIS